MEMEMNPFASLPSANESRPPLPSRRGVVESMSFKERRKKAEQFNELSRRIEEIDEDFFVPTTEFRTITHDLKVLCEGTEHGGSVGAAGEDGTPAIDLSRNAAYLDLVRQRDVTKEVVGAVLAGHHAALSAAVRGVGAAAASFEGAGEEVRAARAQVAAARERLTTGFRQHSLRELWARRRAHAAVLRLLADVQVVRDAPARAMALAKARRWLAAAGAVRRATARMWRGHLVGVAGLGPARDRLLRLKDELQQQLGRAATALLFLRDGDTNGGGGGAVAAAGDGVEAEAVRIFENTLVRHQSHPHLIHHHSSGPAFHLHPPDGAQATSAGPSAPPSIMELDPSTPPLAAGAAQGLDLSALEPTEELEAALYPWQTEGTAFEEHLPLQPSAAAAAAAGVPAAAAAGAGAGAAAAARLALLAEAARRAGAGGVAGVHDLRQAVQDSLKDETRAAAKSIGQGVARLLEARGLTAQRDKTYLLHYMRTIFGVFLKILNNFILFEKIIKLTLEKEASATAEDKAFTPCREVWMHMQDLLIEILTPYLSEPGLGYMTSPIKSDGFAFGLGGGGGAAAAAAPEGDGGGSGGGGGPLAGLLELVGWGQAGGGGPEGGGALDSQLSANGQADGQELPILCERTPYNAVVVFRTLSWFDQKVSNLLLNLDAFKAASEQPDSPASPMIGPADSQQSVGPGDKKESKIMDWINGVIERDLVPVLQRDAAAGHREALRDGDPFAAVSAAAAAAAAGGDAAAAARRKKKGGAGAVDARRTSDIGGRGAAAAAAADAARPSKMAHRTWTVLKRLLGALGEVDARHGEALGAVLCRAADDFLGAAREAAGLAAFPGGGGGGGSGGSSSSEARRRVAGYLGHLEGVLRGDPDYRRHKRRLYGARWVAEQGLRRPPAAARERADQARDRFEEETKLHADLFDYRALAAAAAAAAAGGGGGGGGAGGRHPLLAGAGRLLSSDRRAAARLAALAYSMDWLGAKLYRGLRGTRRRHRHRRRRRHGASPAPSLLGLGFPGSGGGSPRESDYDSDTWSLAESSMGGSVISGAASELGRNMIDGMPPIGQPPLARPPSAFGPGGGGGGGPGGGGGGPGGGGGGGGGPPEALLRRAADLARGADECLLVLRVELILSSCLAIKSFTELDLTSNKPVSDRASELPGPLKSFEKTLRNFQDAISASLPAEACTFVFSIIYELVPFLVIKAVEAFPEEGISNEGAERAQRAAAALHRALAGVLAAAAGPSTPQGGGGAAAAAALAEGFARARDYLRLLGAEGGGAEGLRAYRAQHPRRFTARQYEVLGQLINSKN